MNLRIFNYENVKKKQISKLRNVFRYLGTIYILLFEKNSYFYLRFDGDELASPLDQYFQL